MPMLASSLGSQSHEAQLLANASNPESWNMPGGRNQSVTRGWLVTSARCQGNKATSSTSSVFIFCKRDLDLHEERESHGRTENHQDQCHGPYHVQIWNRKRREQTNQVAGLLSKRQDARDRERSCKEPQKGSLMVETRSSVTAASAADVPLIAWASCAQVLGLLGWPTALSNAQPPANPHSHRHCRGACRWARQRGLRPQAANAKRKVQKVQKVLVPRCHGATCNQTAVWSLLGATVSSMAWTL